MAVSQTGLRIFRWGWLTFVVIATSVPYLLNWFSTPAGFHYTWIVPPYPEDSLAYMAWSQQAAHGSLLFHLKYTALPHSAFLFHPLFLICGWFSFLFACDLGMVHWAMKAVGVACFFFVFYRYTDFLGLNRFQSMMASIFVGISSGVGGLVSYFIQPDRLGFQPADLWVVDSNTYWSLLWNPLFPYSLTLLLLAIYWLDRGTRNARRSDFWLGGLASGILALLHPYSQPLLFSFAVLITIWRRRAEMLQYLGRFLSTALPSVLYLFLVTEFHPLISKHSSFGEMKSPPIVAYILGFGFPLVLAAVGLMLERGRWVKRYGSIIIWFFLSLGFAYLPIWFQRKLIFGAHIPLCILAGLSFDLVWAKCFGVSKRRWALVVAAAVLLPLLASTQMVLLISERNEVRDNADGAYFISDDMMMGLKFLKDKTKSSEIVFATPETSRLIPALSGNTVLWGHWAQSVDFEERQKWISNLLDEQLDWADDVRIRRFWDAGIDYIFSDQAMQQSLKDNPQVKAWPSILREANKVFENGSVTIYQRRDRKGTQGGTSK